MGNKVIHTNLFVLEVKMYIFVNDVRYKKC